MKSRSIRVVDLLCICFLESYLLDYLHRAAYLDDTTFDLLAQNRPQGLLTVKPSSESLKTNYEDVVWKKRNGTGRDGRSR